jgi:RNA polymerase sigma factor (sigma-70 family)
MFNLNKNNRSQLSDKELVERYRYSYDTAYIGVLFERYTPLLFGVCMKYLENEERAKDAVMEVFEKVLTDLRRHDVEEFRPWIYTVAKNHCLMGIRKEKTTDARQEEYARFASAIVEMDEIVHLNGAEDPINDAQLYAAIGNLKDDQQLCVRLFYFEKKSYEQIQEMTGLSFKEVKSHLQNGKRNLKVQLTKGNE